jgi:hypothetical protein
MSCKQFDDRTMPHLIPVQFKGLLLAPIADQPRHPDDIDIMMIMHDIHVDGMRKLQDQWTCTSGHV